MGLTKWAKDVSKTNCATDGQGVSFNIDNDTVKIREIELDAVMDPPKSS